MNIKVVYKKSKFELYSNSPDKHVRDFVKNDAEYAEKIMRSHKTHMTTLDIIVRELDNAGVSYDMVYRGDLSEIRNAGLVVVVGGDGTMLDASHYITDIPVLGVNSDPEFSTGFFSVCTAGTFGNVLHNIDKLYVNKLNRFEIEIDSRKIPELALNNIHISNIDPNEMISYRLNADGNARDYRSDGLLVSTAAGSTAWIYNLGGCIMPLSLTEMQYISKGLRNEKPRFANELDVASYIREGIACIDVSFITYKFTIGSIIKIRNGKPLTLLGDIDTKRDCYIK